MINFNDELQKFKPCLQVNNNLDNDIQSIDEVRDVLDLLETILKAEESHQSVEA